MATGTRTEHQNERVVTEAVFPVAVTVQPLDLTSTGQTYFVSPVKGYIKEVNTVVNVLTAGESTLTVKAPDGTVGSVTIADASAVGTIDTLGAAPENNEVEKGEVVEIENNNTPTAGAITVTVILEESA